MKKKIVVGVFFILNFGNKKKKIIIKLNFLKNKKSK